MTSVIIIAVAIGLVIALGTGLLRLVKFRPSPAQIHAHEYAQRAAANYALCNRVTLSRLHPLGLLAYREGRDRLLQQDIGKAILVEALEIRTMLDQSAGLAKVSA